MAATKEVGGRFRQARALAALPEPNDFVTLLPAEVLDVVYDLDGVYFSERLLTGPATHIMRERILRCGPLGPHSIVTWTSFATPYPIDKRSVAWACVWDEVPNA